MSTSILLLIFITKKNTQSGISLVELLASLSIAAILMVGISTVISNSLLTQNVVQSNNQRNDQARFAMQKMVAAISNTKRLLLPLADNPATTWQENIREQSIPAVAAQSGSTFASAVLAVTLDPQQDLDNDGWSDANNDKDFLDINQNGNRDPNEPERIDEDPWGDNSNDGAPGIIGIDDNGDGSIDNSSAFYDFPDDDEDHSYDEDNEGGGDEDGDGSIDEDMNRDQNGDGAPGVAGVDDDLDGTIDEGSYYDDDEDGLSHEDSYEPVVFYLNGNTLIERQPALMDINADSQITGNDFFENSIAENVSYFRVERIKQLNKKTVIHLTLELLDNNNDRIRLQTRVRVGGGK